MKISKDCIPYTYQESKRIFDNNLSVKEAAENIHSKYGIKITSSADYAYFFRYLITGEGSCRSLNTFTQEYYLNKIHKDYGKEQFEKSLVAFKKLIEKFEGIKVGSKKGMRVIYEKYIKSI